MADEETTETEPEPFERSPEEAARLIEEGARLVDVRMAHEFDAGRIPGADRIGLEEVAGRREEIDRDRPVLFYCRMGNRSAMAATAFGEAGYEAHSLAGGITAWLEAGRELDPAGGYIAEPGEAAAILEARSKAASE